MVRCMSSFARCSSSRHTADLQRAIDGRLRPTAGAVGLEVEVHVRDVDPRTVETRAALSEQFPGAFMLDMNTGALEHRERCPMNLKNLFLRQRAILPAVGTPSRHVRLPPGYHHPRHQT